jgi:hypothetical protein
MQGTCILCNTSCQTCKDNSLCVSCKEGYYNSTNVHFSLCSTCPIGCRTCSSSTSCQSCNPEFYLSASLCVACTSNCLTCTVSGCTQCNTASTLISGLCYLCTDASKSGSIGCITCQTTSNLIYCTNTSASYYLNNGLSVACATTFTNSLYCTSAGPLQCLTDYHSTLTNRNHLINGQCVPNVKSCKMMKSSSGDCA